MTTLARRAIFPVSLVPMLALLVSSMLLAPPSIAVVVSRRVDVKADAIARVTGALEDALAAEGVAGVLGAGEAKRRMAEQGVDSASCGDDRVCLLGVLHLLKVDVLVAVDLGHVVDQYALRVSAIDSEQGAPLAERGALVKARQLAAAVPDEARAFAKALKVALDARPARPQPVVEQPAPIVITTPAPSPGSPSR